MVLPLQDKLEDWRKCAITMDKDHAKEYKKMRSEVKKRSEAVQRAQKKQRKQSKTNDPNITKALGMLTINIIKFTISPLDGQTSLCFDSERVSANAHFVTIKFGP